MAYQISCLFDAFRNSGLFHNSISGTASFERGPLHIIAWSDCSLLGEFGPAQALESKVSSKSECCAIWLTIRAFGIMITVAILESRYEQQQVRCQHRESFAGNRDSSHHYPLIADWVSLAVSFLTIAMFLGQA